MSLVLELDSGEKINMIAVYFPCFSSSITYSANLAECLSFIEDVLADGQQAIILGDMNFQCDINNEGYKQCYNVLSDYDIYHCDEFIG